MTKDASTSTGVPGTIFMPAGRPGQGHGDSGEASDFTVRVGIGKWLEHLGVAAVETLLISDLFLVVDVAESAWNIEIEEKLVKQIESLVG